MQNSQEAVNNSIKEIDRRLLNDGDRSPAEPAMLHSYPGSIPAFLASRLLDLYSKPGEIIFDPHCGTGTILIEGIRLGRHVIGCDLLDISVRIARTAMSLPDPEVITDEWKRIKRNALNSLPLLPAKEEVYSDDLNIGELKNWLHLRTLSEVSTISEQIRRFEDPSLAELFTIILCGCFQTLSRRHSRGTVHWGWIADNVVPKRPDIVYVNALSMLDERINKLTSFMKVVNSTAINKDSKENAVIFQNDWLNRKQSLPINIPKVDLLITSPPYPYSIDYTLALRLTYYYLGIDFSQLRKNEIGARYKRKRQNRTKQYLEELAYSLKVTSGYVKQGGRAIYVLPDPEGYEGVLPFSRSE